MCQCKVPPLYTTVNAGTLNLSVAGGARPPEPPIWSAGASGAVEIPSPAPPVHKQRVHQLAQVQLVNSVSPALIDDLVSGGRDIGRSSD